MAPLLKAAYNRVRTSDALKVNSRWTDIVGVEAFESKNAVEDMLNETALKNVKGGGKRSDRKTVGEGVAAEMLGRTGGFGTGATDIDSLIDLAKQRGALGGDPARGACKRCGEVGHLTKDCRNFLADYYREEQEALRLMAGGGQPAGPPPGEESDLDSLLGSDSSSSRSSDSESEGDRRKSKKSKRSKSKKEKKSKKKSKKASKERKSRRDRSRSRSREREGGRGDRDRDREREGRDERRGEREKERDRRRDRSRSRERDRRGRSRSRD